MEKRRLRQEWRKGGEREKRNKIIKIKKKDEGFK